MTQPTKLLLAVLFLPFTIIAQSDFMLYNYDAIGQSLHVNPATPQQTKVWIGLPVLSNYSLHYHNNGFSPVDVLEEGTDPNENLAEVSRALDGRSQLSMNFSTDLLSIGFQTKKGFVSFGANQQIDFSMDMPAELFQLLFDSIGGASATDFNMREFDFEAISRTNYYVGYQHRLLDDKLSLGVRLKYVIGQGHGYIERSELGIKTDANRDTLTASTDILVRTAGFPNMGDDAGPMSAAFSSNTGFAFDLGFNYIINDKWSVSGSILDVGSIRWQENTKEYVSKGEYHFEGIDVDLSDPEVGNSYENSMDSLEAALNIEEREGSGYSRSLMKRLYLGGTYRLTDKHSFSGLYHARIWNSTMYHDFGVKYHGRLSRGFQFTGGYTIINGTYNNVGVGFNVKMGPVQLFMMTENIIGAIDYPGVNTTNFRMGINLSFYGKKKKDKEEQEKEIEEVEENN